MVHSTGVEPHENSAAGDDEEALKKIGFVVREEGRRGRAGSSVAEARQVSPS